MSTIEEAFAEAHAGHARDGDGEWVGPQCPRCRDNRALALATAHEAMSCVGDEAWERLRLRIEALGVVQ